MEQRLLKLKDATPNIGLYRDYSLAVIRATCSKTESVKKSICEIFEKLGLAVTIEANSKSVNFLDVNLDLRTGLYKPYLIFLVKLIAI